MLLEYLCENYSVNEPIFIADIDLGVTNGNLRQMFKKLCDEGKIARYDTGIYYLKGESRLKGGIPLSADKVVRYRYIIRNNQVNGYYSGYTFANQLGLISQVPVATEIVSNQASAKRREVILGKQRVILRKPRVKITEDNYKVLQLLDLLKDIDVYTDGDVRNAAERLGAYMKEIGIKQSDIDEYISFYPERIYKNIYDMRLYNSFA